MKWMLIRIVTISASIHRDSGKHKIAACQSILAENTVQHTTWQLAPLGRRSRKRGSISCQISSHSFSTFPLDLCSCSVCWAIVSSVSSAQESLCWAESRAEAAQGSCDLQCPLHAEQLGFSWFLMHSSLQQQPPRAGKVGECYRLGIISDPLGGRKEGRVGICPPTAPRLSSALWSGPSWSPSSCSFSVVLLLSSIFNHQADQASFSGRHRNQGFLCALAALVFNSRKSKVVREIQGEILIQWHSVRLSVHSNSVRTCPTTVLIALWHILSLGSVPPLNWDHLNPIPSLMLSTDFSAATGQ